MPTVELPNGKRVRFPTGTAFNDIDSTLRRDFPDFFVSIPGPAPAIGGEELRQLPDLQATTHGGPPVQIGSMGQAVRDVGEAVSEIPGAVGRGFGFWGDVARAGVADVAAGMRSLKTGPKEASQFSGNLPSIFTGEEMPVDVALQQASQEQKERGEFGVETIAARASQGLAKISPKLAALPAVGGGLLAQSLAAGALFGLDDEGNFHPKEAAIAALIPGVGVAARKAAGVALTSAIQSGSKIAANPAAQKLVELAADNAAVGAYLVATSTPELIELSHSDPDEFRKQLGEIIAMQLGFGLLGLRHLKSEAPSQTQKWIEARGLEMATKMITNQKYADYVDAAARAGGAPVEQPAGQRAVEAAVYEFNRRQDQGEVSVLPEPLPTEMEYAGGEMPRYREVPVPEPTKGGGTSASKIRSTTEVPQREVRPQVGEETPLRQPGEAPKETPGVQEVAAAPDLKPPTPAPTEAAGKQPTPAAEKGGVGPAEQSYLEGQAARINRMLESQPDDPRLLASLAIVEAKLGNPSALDNLAGADLFQRERYDPGYAKKELDAAHKLIDPIRAQLESTMRERMANRPRGGLQEVIRQVEELQRLRLRDTTQDRVEAKPGETPGVQEVAAAPDLKPPTPAPTEAEGKKPWSESPGNKIQAPLSSWKDYVISHREGRFTLSYRPKGEHIPLGEFPTLTEAKAAAEKHSISAPSTPAAREGGGKVSPIVDHWRAHVEPALHDFFKAATSFGIDRLEKNRIKPEGMSLSDWVQKVSAQTASWDRGRKIGVTGLEMLKQKNLWPTEGPEGEMLRKSMFKAVQELKRAPGSRGDWISAQEQSATQRTGTPTPAAAEKGAEGKAITLAESVRAKTAQTELQAADDFAGKASVEAEKAVVAWATHVEDVVNPLKAKIRKIKSEVVQMEGDARRTKPETKSSQRLTKKKFLEQYGVATKDEANALYKQKNAEWAELEKQLGAAEEKRKELESAKDRRGKEWSAAATRAGELRREVYPKVKEGDVGQFPPSEPGAEIKGEAEAAPAPKAEPPPQAAAPEQPPPIIGMGGAVPPTAQLGESTAGAAMAGPPLGPAAAPTVFLTPKSQRQNPC